MAADLRLIIPMSISFIIVLLVIPSWIKKAKNIGLIWEDMNKYQKVYAAGSGGLIVLLGFVIGLLSYVAYRVFILNEGNHFLVEIFALLAVVLILGGIGLIDDLLGWKHGGLRRRTRILLVVVASIPLIAINAGRSVVTVPFIGNVDLGIIYPILIIPLGIVGAVTTFNFLAGFNGQEAGQGIIILTALSIVAYLTGSSWLTVIGLCMVAALCAFLFFNYPPAKIFPGDSLTYSVGGLIAIMAIIGNFERIAVFFFIPYIIETALKSRGKLIKQSFGKPDNKGNLDLKYNKIYSLNHLAIWLLNKTKLKANEEKVTLSIWLFQILVIILGFIIFNGSLF
ncbi:glycosyl transferase family 4 [Candidatus Pacearchaeota archaeon]|nr:glycosyl transferase family 4 [Candidatus Pacearchaeota archaeon]